jgi:hypothetical protein
MDPSRMGATLGHKKAQAGDPEANQFRIIVNAECAAFLKKTRRTLSDRAALLFTIKITSTNNTEKFSGLNEREIVILLLGRVPAP